MGYILVAVLIILLIILSIYIAMLNPVQVVVNLPLLGTFVDVPLTMVMLGSVLIGVLVSFSIVLVKEVRRSLQQWGEVRKGRRNESISRQYARGLQLLVSGRSDEATDCFKRLLGKHSQHLEAHIALGDIYFSAGDWEQATHYHSRGLELNGGNASLMLKLAQDYQQAGKIDMAIDVLQRIIQTDRENLTARIRLKGLYCNQGRWDKAYELQQQVVAQTLSKPQKEQEQQTLLGLRYELASTQAARGQHQEAIKALKEIIKEDKQFLPVYMQLADIYLKQGESAAAIQVIERGYQQSPSLILLKRLEELNLSQEDPQRAIGVYRQAVRTRPQDFGLNLFLGMLYLKLEMLKEAKEQFQYLIQQGKDFPLLHYELAEVQERQKQYELSCEEYRRVFKVQGEQLLRYTCGECGASFPRWEGRCHHCGHWNTISWQV